MAISYGNKNVDERYAPIFEPNLFAHVVFRPGVSYTDKYQIGPAGQIYVHKAGIATLTAGSPGADFSDVDVADSLIVITLDQAFRRSRKVYAAQSAATAANLESEELATASREVGQAWQVGAMAALVAGATASAVTTATATAADFKTNFIAVRKELRDNYAMPTVAQLSTKQYSNALDYSGREFQPSANDEILRSGVLGKFFGVNIFETALLTDVGTTGSVEFVMYDHEAYSIVNVLEMMRLIDSELFNGKKAQVEMITGFKVTNADRVIKKTVA